MHRNDAKGSCFSAALRRREGWVVGSGQDRRTSSSGLLNFRLLSNTFTSSTTKGQICYLDCHIKTSQGKSLVKTVSHVDHCSFLTATFVLSERITVVVWIRTDTRNSTEYWPCAASDVIQPRAMMVKFSCSTLRGEYLCHTFDSLIRLED